MSFLYCTADQVGRPDHGGGGVTGHESAALRELGPTEVWGREQLPLNERVYGAVHEWAYQDPWGYDYRALRKLTDSGLRPALAHCYAGTFSNTIGHLRAVGCKVCYTAAAHDVAASRRAHEELGVPYDYPHLTDPVLWERYVRGYLEADVLVCPSTHSANVMRGFGAKNRIEVIPHGVDLPVCQNCGGTNRFFIPNALDKDPPGEYVDCVHCRGTLVEPVAPLPNRFVVGYLGAVGPDKGLIDLLRAWRNLQCPDAELVLAGGQSQSPFVQSLINHVNNEQKRGFTGPPIRLMGWVENISDFYNICSVYCQPSVTEGFGIETAESMSFGRMALCSTGAGSSDIVDPDWRFAPCNPAELAAKIDWARAVCHEKTEYARALVAPYTWDRIHQRYVALWSNLLE